MTYILRKAGAQYSKKKKGTKEGIGNGGNGDKESGR